MLPPVQQKSVGEKKCEAAQYVLPKWATDLIENVQFLSDGHKHVDALGSTSKAKRL